MKATDILWDIEDGISLNDLPKEIVIPDNITDEDEISDYLSETTGWCHRGFDLVDERD